MEIPEILLQKEVVLALTVLHFRLFVSLAWRVVIKCSLDDLLGKGNITTCV